MNELLDGAAAARTDTSCECSMPALLSNLSAKMHFGSFVVFKRELKFVIALEKQVLKLFSV